MCHSICHSLQSYSPEEENDEDHIGIECCDVDDKGVLCDAFDDAQVNEAPESKFNWQAFIRTNSFPKFSMLRLTFFGLFNYDAFFKWLVYLMNVNKWGPSIRYYSFNKIPITKIKYKSQWNPYHAENKHKAMTQLKLLGFSMSSEIFKVSRYQKYWVGLLN